MKAGKIRLETCIISVTDVVEAMVTHRPYRPSLGLNAALNEISEKKGLCYHPDAVEACITLFAKKAMRLIKIQYIMYLTVISFFE